jgi:hypothetical protein
MASLDRRWPQPVRRCGVRMIFADVAIGGGVLVLILIIIVIVILVRR